MEIGSGRRAVKSQNAVMSLVSLASSFMQRIDGMPP